MAPVTLESVVDQILTWDRTARYLIAVAGPPGAGKSTWAEALNESLRSRDPALSAILPMDGFHFDDRVLQERGDLPRKGAPHTFDTGGLVAMLDRVAADTGETVAIPTFDRELEIARAGSRIIEPDVRVVIVEGNYLLLDDPVWANIRRHCALTIFIDAPEAVLVERLRRRWDDLGYTRDAGRQKLEANDLPNVRLVLGHSVEADVVVNSATS